MAKGRALSHEGLKNHDILLRGATAVVGKQIRDVGVVTDQEIQLVLGRGWTLTITTHLQDTERDERPVLAVQVHRPDRTRRQHG